MKRRMLGLAILGLALSGTIVSGCASKPPQAGIESTANPSDEIAKMGSNLETARNAHVDVLAKKPFIQSEEYLEKAKTAMDDHKDQEKIIDNIRYSRVYLTEAYSMANGRQAQAPGLLDARRDAKAAGAAYYPELKDQWRATNNDVSSEADHLDKLSVEKVNKLQNQYIDLERRAIEEKQIGSAKNIIKDARKADASTRAPETFKKAELSLRNAETVIATNMKSPAAYQQAVSEAKSNALLLSEVMTTIETNGKKLPESAALRMVAQKHQINNLKQDVSASQAEVAGAENQLQTQDAQLASRNAELAKQKKALTSAEATVALQKAIQDTRGQFSNSEAEVYQQGGDLLIRLKSVNFASGKAELPTPAIPLLAKVSEVAKSLNASEIKVEGHTDSVGTEEVNKSLSEKRATAVATYLKSNGFNDIDVESEGLGFDKPIASNKSKAGRAQNRRVDIIITPSAKTVSE